MFPDDIAQLAKKVIATYSGSGLKIATAESLTGGLICAALTEVSGSSAVIDRGFITYSNDAKIELLGVAPEQIMEHGAVDARTAQAMAEGALEFSRATVAISVTGLAGPSGATPDKPIGLVYIGIAKRTGAVFHYKCQFAGDRHDIRLATVREALKLLLSVAEDSSDVE